MRLIGVGLLLAGGLTVWRATRPAGGVELGQRAAPALPATGTSTPARVWIGARASLAGAPGAGGTGRFRAGPWPGLSPSGAVVLLGCALLVAGGQLVLGDPRRLLPDLPLLGLAAVLPVALATRLVRAPGAASAVCGAYLLPRALLSLLDPDIAPPVLLLVPAVAFDVSAWLRASDLDGLTHRTSRVTARVRPWLGLRAARSRLTRLTGRVRSSGIAGKTPDVTSHVTPDVTAGMTPHVTARLYAAGGRRGLVGPRRCGRVRAGVAGAFFGGMLTASEPGFRVLLGADPSAWNGTGLWLTAGLTGLACAVAGFIGASGPDTAV